MPCFVEIFEYRQHVYLKSVLNSLKQILQIALHFAYFLSQFSLSWVFHTV